MTMMMNENKYKITIIGLGEFGKIIANLLYSSPSKNYQLIGYDADSNTHSEMKKSKILDKAEWNLKTATFDADIIFICIPKREIFELLKNLKNFVKKDCVIIDTSIFKKEISEFADTLFNESISFIGGSIIFDQQINSKDSQNHFVLIPSSNTSNESMDIIVNLLKTINLSPLFFNIDEYDNFMFALYGLPNLISTAYRNLMMQSPSWREIKKLYGSNFMKLSELSLKEPEIENDLVFLKEQLPSEWIKRFNKNFAYLTESSDNSHQDVINDSEIYREKFFKFKQGINPNSDVSINTNDLSGGMLELLLGSKLTRYFKNSDRIEMNNTSKKDKK
ncbi:MAG: hypothetical protein CL764_02655 [Chloroflexi bacterium]|nr:hypothetical protein [Chloroflexota bacterium]|tara:strand:- start:6134 stop:7135 length:1002 start_codon:yes stop_codon:yes gene_type:complete